MIKKLLKGLGTAVAHLIIIILGIVMVFYMLVIPKETVDKLTIPIIVFAVVVVGLIIMIIMATKKGKSKGFIKKILDWDKKLQEKERKKR